MIIRKRFNVESAHIVRNCTSERCSHSIHGHSAVIEVGFKSRKLDNAQMVVDFGLLKGPVKEFIDSMDHCYLLCSKDKPEFKDFIKKSCDRWIELPFNPSAEMLSVFILAGINHILRRTYFANGEEFVRCVSVRYWETATGSAEAEPEDVERFLPYFNTLQICFSDGVLKDWSEDLIKCWTKQSMIENETPEHQIDL